MTLGAVREYSRVRPPLLAYRSRSDGEPPPPWMRAMHYLRVERGAAPQREGRPTPPSAISTISDCCLISNLSYTASGEKSSDSRSRHAPLEAVRPGHAPLCSGRPGVRVRPAFAFGEDVLGGLTRDSLLLPQTHCETSVDPADGFEVGRAQSHAHGSRPSADLSVAWSLLVTSQGAEPDPRGALEPAQTAHERAKHTGHEQLYQVSRKLRVLHLSLCRSLKPGLSRSQTENRRTVPQLAVGGSLTPHSPMEGRLGPWGQRWPEQGGSRVDSRGLGSGKELLSGSEMFQYPCLDSERSGGGELGTGAGVEDVEGVLRLHR